MELSAYLQAVAYSNAAALKARVAKAVAGIAGATVTDAPVKGDKRAAQKTLDCERKPRSQVCTSPYVT